MMPIGPETTPKAESRLKCRAFWVNNENKQANPVLAGEITWGL